MTKSKFFWLASAAVLAGTSGAQAADLPFRKAAPVEYVRVCDAFGAGFFYIPGTDTCLKVGGQIRAEYTVRATEPHAYATSYALNQAGTLFRRDVSNLRARAYITADSRTQTAYGTLRTFLSFRLTDDSTPVGPFGGRGESKAGLTQGPSTGIFQGYNGNPAVYIDKGFIQFAGLTAGKAQSFFDFDAQSYEILGQSVANSNQPTQLFAYTATFGGGFSATVSVEDRNNRTIGDNGSVVYQGAATTAAAVLAGQGLTGNVNNPSFSRASVLAYDGETIPDIVGNLRYDAPWGAAQLSAAYHEVKSIPLNLFTGTGGPVATREGTPIVQPSADGFAVQGGVKVNLPMLAKGDSVTVQGTYEEGAMDYINALNYYGNGANNVWANNTAGVGSSFNIPVNDAFITPTGKVGLNKAWGVYAAFRHYFTPEWSGTLFGAYLNIDDPLSAQRLGVNFDSATVWQIGGNVIWSPVKDLQIGGEVLYTNLDYANKTCGLAATAALCGGNTGAGLGTTPKNPDDLRGRFTVRRAF